MSHYSLVTTFSIKIFFLYRCPGFIKPKRLRSDSKNLFSTEFCIKASLHKVYDLPKEKERKKLRE